MPVYKLSFENGQFQVLCRYSDGIPFTVCTSHDLVTCLSYISGCTGGPVVLDIVHRR